ncbi:hypothetical protein HU675_0026360 [Bradyrhizobium septentrionale]|uniref:hypothetical protein n=1 Tax=Bradyrhizobium septentrionale TaxID=1404411 RepID=UPI00048BAFC8|nr:hypothetical protein [Bradyrhizobium septentrionale]UGY21546.1 hypothetical protein HU675_0026360 [Bradyrhizobium septentrionale]
MVDQKKLAKLRQLITEGLRVQLGHEAITYINVGHAMEDISARQNHTVFARRGCGKTLLLHDSAKQLPPEIKAIYLNCEDFKQHTFPNVLIEILSSLFEEIDSHLSGWFGRKRRTKEIIKSIRAKLATMHQSPDVQEEDIRQTTANENALNSEAGLHAEAVNFSLGGSRKTKSETERSFRSHRQKLQELDLWLPELKKSIREFFAVSTNVKCIFLQIDDLYHLKRADQAFVVDYIHRLCKDVPLFFKIATMRHASTMFADREGQPIGAQERHDYQPINIDYTFSDFGRTESQNWQILMEYGRRAGMDKHELDALFKGEGFARLVMAGGGVPRDVLSLFLEAMSQSEGEAVGKDEVRVLSRSNLERRIEELKQDSQIDEQNVLIAGIYVLREFCLAKKTNIFLIPEQLLQQDENWRTLFSRLVDYRIIHQAGSALTHKSQTGNFQAFAIDIGCYAHFRKMEARFNEIDVSKATAKDQMRSAPVLGLSDLQTLFKTVPENAEAVLKTIPEDD